MLLVLAPLLTVIALLTGGVATAVAYVLNGPRRMRRRPEPPIIMMPPVPSPELRRMLESERLVL